MNLILNESTMSCCGRTAGQCNCQTRNERPEPLGQIDWDAFYEQKNVGEHLPVKPVFNTNHGCGLAEVDWDAFYSNEQKALTEPQRVQNTSGGISDPAEAWQQAFEQDARRLRMLKQ